VPAFVIDGGSPPEKVPAGQAVRPRLARKILT